MDHPSLSKSYVRSDLEIPQPLAKFFSLYLLLAIGFKGGIELSHSGFSSDVLITMGAAILMAVAVPVYSYFILRIRLNVFDAGAVAATYGSISAVTFVTADSRYAGDHPERLVLELEIFDQPREHRVFQHIGKIPGMIDVAVIHDFP